MAGRHTRPRGTRSYWAIQSLCKGWRKKDAKAARSRARQKDRKIIREALTSAN